MARLPDANDLGQRPIPVSRRAIATVRNAGAVGNAVEGIGAQIGRTGEILSAVDEQRRDQEARLQAAQARSEFMTQRIAIDSEFENDQDYDTLEQRYSERVSKVSSEAAAKIKSPFARSMFEADVRPDVERGVAGVRKQIFNGRKDQARAMVSTTLSSNLDSLLSARTEEDRIALLNSSRDMLASAKASGFIAATEEVEQRLALTEKYAKGRLSLLPDEDQVVTLTSSLAASEAHPDGKTGTFVDYIPVDERVPLLRAAEARIRAEQSRLKSEKNLELQTAVNRAENVDRLLKDAVPVPNDQIDAAITVAMEAGKDALVYSLQDGKIKSNVSIAFRANTPQQLQPVIDGLSAKINQDKDKAAREDIVTRDHLVTMRDKAKELLAKDPLEFAARAWGTNIPPIDWDSGASIAQRGQLAMSVAKAAAVPPLPLRQQELDLLKDEMDKGAGGQVAVMNKIRRFGPGIANAAARQIAPEDEGFQAAVAIATSPDGGPKAAMDALIGADALKTNPDLYKKDRAEKLYSDFVSPALRLFPPELRRGVSTSAANIYGARMSREGKNEWNEQQWWLSVNQALGQYRDGAGVYRGGLMRYSGGLLLLPSGVAEGEFKSVISKINPKAMGKAGNGLATWDNGSPVKLSDFSRLRFVADGDGFYRLTDGDGFVSVNKTRQPFRIDYRKLAKEVGQ